MVRAVAYKLQERAFGGLGKSTLRRLKSLAGKLEAGGTGDLAAPLSLKPGTRLVREWDGETHSVLVLEKGFEYRGQDYRSLSQLARLPLPLPACPADYRGPLVRPAVLCCEANPEALRATS